MQKHQQFRDYILCQLSDHNAGKNNPSSNNLRHADCPTPQVVSRSKSKGKDVPASPINNFPAYASYDGGVPDAVTLEVFALRRRNAELAAKAETLNKKLSRVLECLQSLRRFFRLWIYEGQGESHDDVTARMKRIDSMIDLIEDRSVGDSPILEIPERWRKLIILLIPLMSI